LTAIADGCHSLQGHARRIGSARKRFVAGQQPDGGVQRELSLMHGRAATSAAAIKRRVAGH
jgi:hypothetical protein